MKIEIAELTIDPARRYVVTIKGGVDPTTAEKIGRSLLEFGFPGKTPILYLRDDQEIHIYNLFGGDVFTVTNTNAQEKMLMSQNMPDIFTDLTCESNKVMLTLPDETPKEKTPLQRLLEKNFNNEEN